MGRGAPRREHLARYAAFRQWAGCGREKRVAKLHGEAHVFAAKATPLEMLMRATSVHLQSRRSAWTRAGMAVASFVLATLVACDAAPWISTDSEGFQIVLQSSDVHVLV